MKAMTDVGPLKMYKPDLRAGDGREKAWFMRNVIDLFDRDGILQHLMLDVIA